jgi:hypothetical protein
MEYCARRVIGQKTCEQKFGASVNSALAVLSSSSTTNISTLAAVYSHVKRDAPNAKILVVGYPRLFPKNPPSGCGTGVPGFTFLVSDMRWMNTEGLKLDDAIAAAAKRFGLTYVNVYNAFQGHELCTKDRYLNQAIIDHRGSVRVWSYHPNLKGQNALAEVVEKSI